VCFELDSLPPVPAISGAAVSHDDLVLEERDGNRFGAYLATPDEPSGIGVVILPDARGLYHFYEELALRLAERGHTAIAIDYFGRTAGVAKRDDDFPYREHTARTTPEGIHGDDQNITAEQNAAFEQALTDAGVEYELVVYEGAPHSFFDRNQAEFAEASDDAWSRVLAFLEHAR
jgi:dienelactone hydrolase